MRHREIQRAGKGPAYHRRAYKRRDNRAFQDSFHEKLTKEHEKMACRIAEEICKKVVENSRGISITCIKWEAGQGASHSLAGKSLSYPQINNSSTNPFLNLALEEYLLKQKDLKEKILILWRNEPAVVIGKNQNAYGEINLPFVEKNQIHVVRRMLGGGAVYHDLGNLNFTILEPEDHRQNQMRVFSAPIIRCLRKYGIRAEFSGRNDILVEGEKVSGSAQYFWKNRVLCHGTLLYATDLKKLSNSLKVDKRKIRAKGIASVRSRIENIETFMAKKISLEEFAEVLAETFFEEVGEKRCVVDLSEKDHEKIAALKKAKYETWQWNFRTFLRQSTRYGRSVSEQGR